MAITDLGTRTLDLYAAWEPYDPIDLDEGNEYLLRCLTSSPDPSNVYSYLLIRWSYSVTGQTIVYVGEPPRIFYDNNTQYVLFVVPEQIGKNGSWQPQAKRISLYSNPPSVSDMSLQLSIDPTEFRKL